VSHLFDLCRQSIVFEKTEDLARCLAAISSDDDILIVGVKNRLSKDYDAMHTMGYRDVRLNLRIHTPKTEHWGLDLHVCEVQLMLQSYAQMKNEAGHRRYIMFRNARGT